MSQNSLVLPTTGTLSGLAAVQGMNNALDTLNTLAAGSAAPSSPEAGQFWHDTTNNVLKIRSLDNSSWISVVALDEVNYLSTARPTPTLFGLTLSNDTTTPNTILDIAAGGAIDSTATYFMRLTAAFKKSFASTWVAGSGNGGLDTGTLAASSGYHVHLIYNPSTKAVDVVASLSYTSPGLPSGFTAFVPIGGFTTDASAHIRAFVQNGNEFLYPTGVQNVNSAVSATPTLVSLSVPTGMKVNALYRAVLTSLSPGAVPGQIFQSPDETVESPGTANASLYCSAYVSGGAEGAAAGHYNTRTNISGQILVTSVVSTSNASIAIYTYGFIYGRGLV